MSSVALIQFDSTLTYSETHMHAITCKDDGTPLPFAPAQGICRASLKEKIHTSTGHIPG
jgi:ribosomal protein S14